MGESGRIHAAGEWWRGLSRAWRANIALYALATISLVALIAQIAAGGGSAPRRVEVASRAAKPTPTSLRPPVTTPQTTTTAAAAPPASPDTTLPPAPAAPDRSPAPVPLSVDPNPPPEQPTTPPTVPCRNSVEPRCGSFFWDPPAGDNKQLTITVAPAGSAGLVTFAVTVTDPDHGVTTNCAVIEYGDGPVERPPCNPAPCPDAHGPWDPPAKETGRQNFMYVHQYAPGVWTAKFTFHTDLDRCPDPYGNTASVSVLVQA